MPATPEEKEFLYGLARYLAEDHAGFPDERAARRAQILDRGVLAQFWFNWRPVGATVGAIGELREGTTTGFRRHHINDRHGWTSRLLSQEWLGLGAEGWFREYEIRNRTVIGLPGEMTTLDQKQTIAWVELDDPNLFHNHTSGFRILAPERDWALASGRLENIRTGVTEFFVNP